MDKLDQPLHLLFNSRLKVNHDCYQVTQGCFVDALKLFMFEFGWRQEGSSVYLPDWGLYTFLLDGNNQKKQLACRNLDILETNRPTDYAHLALEVPEPEMAKERLLKWAKDNIVNVISCEDVTGNGDKWMIQLDILMFAIEFVKEPE